jgi:hypothetical protein
MSGQCIEVPKLPKGKHIDNCLPEARFNLFPISFDIKNSYGAISSILTRGGLRTPIGHRFPLNSFVARRAGRGADLLAELLCSWA